MADIAVKGSHLRFDWPLTGKLRNDVDPMLIGETNFRSLVNMRYKTDCPKGILGMTRINAIPLPQSSIEGGFHFKENSPYESNILIQAKSINEPTTSTLYISDNTDKVPNPDTFSEFKKLKGTGRVSFGNAPDGAMTVMNGKDSLIWGGRESRVAYYANFDKYPDPGFWYNYTDVVNNRLDDEDNVAYFRGSGEGGNDVNTLLLLHGDVIPYIDSSRYHRPLTMTSGSGLSPSLSPAFDQAIVVTPDDVFDYIELSDGMGFDFSGGSWMIEFWFKTEGSAEQAGVARSFKMYDDSNKMEICLVEHRPVYIISLAVWKNNIKTIYLETPAKFLRVWNYVAVSQRGDNINIFFGSQAGIAQSVASLNTTERIPKMNNPRTFILYGSDGLFDEFRVSNVYRYDRDFSVPIVPYNADHSEEDKLFIASIKPIQGVKWYLKDANTNDNSSVLVKYWDGAEFVNVSNLVDGTLVGTKTLAKTGSISFDSTLPVARLRFINNILAYFYEFIFTNVSSSTTIYSVTVDYEIQPIIDTWDGNLRPTSRVLYYKKSMDGIPQDVTMNVSSQDYNSDSPHTYCDLSGMLQEGAIVYGSKMKLAGFFLDFPDLTYVNNKNLSVRIYYYDGNNWQKVIYIDDSTSSHGVTFNHRGAITWFIPDEGSEFTTTMWDSVEFFYYKIMLSGALAESLGNTRLDYIAGIEAPIPIHPYLFSVMWQNRLWLCNDQYQSPNVALCSSYSTNCVFNGEDSGVLTFGDKEGLVCGNTLYSRFGSNIYDNMVLLKRNATYLVDGTSIDTWTKYTVSDSIGCVAPFTLQKGDISYEIAQGITKHILMWRSSRGIEFFDGNSLSPVSDDIGNFFDPSSRDYINAQIYDSNDESSFYDDNYYEYHWLFKNIDGNREFVYNLRYKKWYEIQRGAGNNLKCAFNAIEDMGTRYNYGGSSDGRVLRLDNGTTFDGTPITCTLWTGDIEVVKSGNYVTKLRNLKLFARSKESEKIIEITHYADTEEAGTRLDNIVQNNKGRIYQAKCPVNLDAVLHGLKYSTTTDNEKSGFEPFIISGLFIVNREDII